jgi:hypothetical protein
LSVVLKRTLVIAVALGAAWYAMRHPAAQPPLVAPPGPRPGAAAPAPSPASAPAEPATGNASPDRAAFNGAASGSMMRVSGQVERLLADDNDGSPHQRFIIRGESGVTLLIAHNLDLAPRLGGLAVGDAVEVYGEYEWNDRGGLIHWTHKDPRGNHAAGYIEWRGRYYQ